MKIFSLVFILFLASQSFIYSEANKPLVSYEGGVIEESEVLQEGAIPLYEFQIREAEMKQQIVLTMLSERLVAMEEKSSRKNKKQLLQDFIDASYDKETAQKIKSADLISDQTGEQDSLTEEQNRVFQMKYEAENRFIVSLIKKYKVQFNFSRPKPPVVNIETAGQHFWGNPKAEIVIVEFGDMECPYCKRMQNDIQKIKAKYSDKIKWVFLDFPLEFHAQAVEAHKAAHCAADQSGLSKPPGKPSLKNSEKYFAFQQVLYQSSPNLDAKTILGLAGSAKLNMVDFETCLQDKHNSKKNQIEKNVQYGKKLGISGTPTLFINGRYHPGLMDYAEIEEIIKQEL